MLTGVREALNASHPLALLELASTLLSLLDPRSPSPLDDDAPPAQREEVLEPLLEVDRRETSALLAVIGELLDDEVLRVRIGREVRRRGHQLPRWLARLSEVEVYQATEMVHVLGDGDDLMLGVRLADGHKLTLIVYVDHNVGTIVKDAFASERAIAEVVAFGRERAAPGTEWRPIDHADARARITESIDRAAMTYPPFESETWPVSRPLVEWVVRQLPDGGTPYESREWNDEELDAIAARFLASPAGRVFDDDVHRELLDHILWFGSGYGVGDPLRWSPVRVEILLADWVPRKIVAPISQLTLLPELLRAYVSFAGTDLALPGELVEEAVAAVDQWEPEYQELIREARLQGPLAILDSLGVVDRDVDYVEPETLRDVMLEVMRDQVGGEEALVTLDVDPLPDEPFAWGGIPDDVRGVVGEVLTECDRCADARFDVEFRTACRRLLAAVAHAEPVIFRRRARAVTAASAICWIVGKANDEFRGHGPVMVKDLAEHFGIAARTVSARAGTFLRALNLERRDYDFGRMHLHSTAYLTSRQRERIIAERDEIRAWEADQEDA